MNDFHLIFFPDNQNLGVDTKIGFLSGTVPKLLGIWYFSDCANSCLLGLLWKIFNNYN